VPTARRCQGCGATLGEPAAGSTVATCRFCGLAHDTATAIPAFPDAKIVVQYGRPNRTANRAIVAVVLVVVAIIAASALVPALFGLWMARTAVEHVTGMVERPSERAKRTTPADLARLTRAGGWKVLATDPPAGGYTDFDPVASLPWAMAIGKAWASDAVLTRIDVGRVSATGVVDLGGEQTSGYRFASPGRHQQWINETDAGGKPLTATGLLLQIKGTDVSALPYEERFEPGIPAPVSLPLPELLERARRNREFADKPYYSGYLIHLPREGWVWYFSGFSGSGSFPRVRARDGKTYPYR
jgi:hypothetical protein